MSRLHVIPSVLAVFAFVLLGTALAGDARGPAVLPEAVDATAVPDACRSYLRVPADATSVTLPWDQRLSLAACRQLGIDVEPAGSRSEYPNVLARIDLLLDPSLAMYQDVLDRGPTPGLRILAAYGLGMTHRNSIVRAHASVLQPASAAYGGDTYGAYRQLHDPLAALLGHHRTAARAAFGEVLRLAAQYPSAANANPVVTFVVDDARAEVGALEASPDAWPRVSRY